MLEKNKRQKRNITLFLTRAGVLSALYMVLSFVSFPVSNGAIQVRLGEGLSLLAIVFVEAVPALTIGCLAFNLICGLPLLDVFLGALITLVSSALTFLVGKLISISWLRLTLGGLFPTLLNAFLLPLIWLFCYGVIEYAYIVQVAFILVGEGLAVYLLGVPLALSAQRLKDRGVI